MTTLALASLMLAAVTVTPVDSQTGAAPVTVTLPQVVEPGVTTLTLRSNGPVPSPRRQLGAPHVYYELTTTAA